MKNTFSSMTKMAQWATVLVAGLAIAGCGSSSGGGKGGSGGGAGAGGKGGGSAGHGGSTGGTSAGTAGVIGTAGTGGSSAGAGGATGGSAGGTGGSGGATAGSGGSAGSAGRGGSGGSGGATGGTGGTLTTVQLRGQYIVDHVAACGDCHTPNGQDGRPVAGMYLAGNPSFIALPNGDKLGSRNLTSDETGLKNRTDAEIKTMFRDGQRPTATGMEALNPVMPYYVFHNMTDADADAVVAYLRTVPAVANSIPHRGVSFDVPAAAPPIPTAAIPMPLSTWTDQASAMRGRYLATQAGVCIECHTKHLPAGSATVLDETKMFAGGEDFSALFASTLMIMPVSKNLTSDAASGLGNWTVNDVVTVLSQGKAKDGTGICPPMPVGPNGAFGGLTVADTADIANYIKSLPPISNTIVDNCVFPPPTGGGGAGGGTGGRGGAGGATGGSGGAGGATGGAGGATGGAGGGAGGTGGTGGAAGGGGTGGTGGAAGGGGTGGATGGAGGATGGAGGATGGTGGTQ